MTVAIHKTDQLPGVLRGETLKCRCMVTLATRLTPGEHGYAGRTSLRITSADESLPNGIYYLSVHGRTFKVERVGGEWPDLRL
jgi:hypothetical protein